MIDTTLKTVQALVASLESDGYRGKHEALAAGKALIEQMRSALGHPDNIAIADQALALIAQMQREAVQPVADMTLLAGKVAMCRERSDHALPDGVHALYAVALQPSTQAVAYLYRDDAGQLKLAQTTPPPRNAFAVYAAPHPEAQAPMWTPEMFDKLDQLVAELEAPSEAQALDSQLQQPDGHSTCASGVCASTTPPFPTSASGRSDPMYAEAVAVVRQQKRASISTVQRHLRIGYNRAASLLEAMVGDVIAEMPPTTKLLKEKTDGAC